MKTIQSYLLCSSNRARSTMKRYGEEAQLKGTSDGMGMKYDSEVRPRRPGKATVKRNVDEERPN